MCGEGCIAGVFFLEPHNYAWKYLVSITLLQIRGLEQCLQRVMVELAQLKQHFLQLSGAEQNAGDIDANILWASQ